MQGTAKGSLSLSLVAQLKANVCLTAHKQHWVPTSACYFSQDNQWSRQDLYLPGQNNSAEICTRLTYPTTPGLKLIFGGTSRIYDTLYSTKKNKWPKPNSCVCAGFPKWPLNITVFPSEEKELETSE